MRNVMHFLVSFIFVFSVLSCGTSSPGDQFKKALNETAKGNTNAVIDMLATGGEELSQEEKEKIEALYAASAADMESKGGVENVEILSEEVDEEAGTAMVKAKVTYGNGDEEEMEQKFVKEDGKWKFSMEK